MTKNHFLSVNANISAYQAWGQTFSGKGEIYTKIASRSNSDVYMEFVFATDGSGLKIRGSWAGTPNAWKTITLT